jgi:hypothetical protein
VVDLGLRERGLDLRDRRADPDAAGLGAAGDGDPLDPARRRAREVDGALERRLEARRARVRAAQLAALTQAADQPGVAQLAEGLAQLDLADAGRGDLLRRGMTGVAGRGGGDDRDGAEGRGREGGAREAAGGSCAPTYPAEN